MSASLKYFLAVIDGLFLLYWVLAGLSALEILAIPPELMYANHTDPQVVAWNWSFFPLDIMFSILGFAAIRASKKGSPSWRPLAIISLVLTITAGLMAVSYWTILGEFDPSWFIPNLLLCIAPLFFLPKLITESKG